MAPLGTRGFHCCSISTAAARTGRSRCRSVACTQSPMMSASSWRRRTARLRSRHPRRDRTLTAAGRGTCPAFRWPRGSSRRRRPENDVQFLSRDSEVVSRRFCTATRRTYATGFSGGARMVSALACRIADKLAAIAPVAGLRAGRPAPDEPSVPEVHDCLPARPVPVLAFHGQQDFVNPYLGNADLRVGLLSARRHPDLGSPRQLPAWSAGQPGRRERDPPHVHGLPRQRLRGAVSRRQRHAPLALPDRRPRCDRCLAHHVGLLRALPRAGVRRGGDPRPGWACSRSCS